MSISPWYVGMTGESFLMYCRKDNSGALPLANVSANQLSLSIKNSNNVVSQGGGIFAIVNADEGVVQYQPANSDVVQPGTFYITVEVQQQNGPIFSDPIEWIIEAV